MKNNWEYPIQNDKYKDEKDFNLEMLYRQAHTELSLQQSKRDQIITIYLALCSFLIPFALGEEMISWPMKGIIFLAIGMIGVIFSFICIRYRIYKESYWLCCQSLTVLFNFKENEIDKNTVQQVFFHCLYKKGRGFCIEDGDRLTFSKKKFVKKNIFSAETLHFMIIALMTSFIFALSASLLIDVAMPTKIAASVAVGIVSFLFLVSEYFGECEKIYSFIALGEDKSDIKNQSFNKVFSKAWFLHFYH